VKLILQKIKNEKKANRNLSANEIYFFIVKFSWQGWAFWNGCKCGRRMTFLNWSLIWFRNKYTLVWGLVWSRTVISRTLCNDWEICFWWKSNPRPQKRYTVCCLITWPLRPYSGIGKFDTMDIKFFVGESASTIYIDSYSLLLFLTI